MTFDPMNPAPPVTSNRIANIRSLIGSAGLALVLADHGHQIVSVLAVRHPCNDRLHLPGCKEAATERRFFRTADFDPLTLLNGPHICRGLVQAAARAGVQ